MKRTFPGWWAGLDVSGRVVQVAASQESLLGPWTRENVVRCRVVLDPERKSSRLGRAAQARRAAGGPRALGRLSASIAEWAVIRTEILERDLHRCVACGSYTRALEVHHIEKASQGGTDFDRDLLVTLCTACHAKTDESFASGRLLVIPLGAGRFDCRLVRKPSKFAPDPVAP